MNVLGLDISKSSVSCCLLSSLPTEPRQLYYDYPFIKCEANAKGIRAMLELKPDVAVLEPTGVNYSRLWGTHLARAGVEVVLVGHKQLRYYRAEHLQLPDKDDDADALALACYYLSYQGDRSRFVQLREHIIVRIRTLVLRLAHLNRVQSPIINRARQDLAWQFPEVALVRSLRSGNNSPLLWAWLAEERKSTRYDNLLKESVGLGLQDSVKWHAKRICDLQQEEMLIERELAVLMADARFNPYRAVFAQFGFGLRVQGILLSQIYPIESYLGEDGKPIVQVKRGKNSGKPTARHLSLRRFHKALGVAPTREESGDSKKKKVVGGSDLCRKALWQWLFTRIEPERTRPKNAIGKALGEAIDLQKTIGTPIRLARSRVMARAVKMLFRELTRESE